MYNKTKYTAHYFEVVAENRMKQIREFCKENGIDNYFDLVEYCKENNPEWLKTIMSNGGCRAMVKFFEREEWSKIQDEKRKKIMAAEGPNTRKPRAVICTDNGMEFSSINKAAAWLGIKKTQMVSDCCRGIVPDVRGYHFQFKEAFPSTDTEEKSNE